MSLSKFVFKKSTSFFSRASDERSTSSKNVRLKNRRAANAASQTHLAGPDFDYFEDLAAANAALRQRVARLERERDKSRDSAQREARSV